MYPDVGQVIGNKQSVVFKITMAVYAKSVEAKDDLRAFVWDFGQEYNQVNSVEPWNSGTFGNPYFFRYFGFFRSLASCPSPPDQMQIFSKKTENLLCAEVVCEPMLLLVTERHS